MTSEYVEVTELTSKHPSYQRLNELKLFYNKQFDAEPQFFVRVPGRVNIIGEHVDYCGYPVLPMALEQSILLAVGCVNSEKPTLTLHNIQTKKFQPYECSLLDVNIALPPKGCGPAWYNYFLCGLKGIQETLSSAQQQQQLQSIQVALSGNIPPASGLSSSSALVSAAVLAIAHVFGLKLERKRLASIAACCERYIGTQGGGMDQAIAYLAKAGCAQFIEFQPELKATSVQLPAGACFVVANSLAEINKAATSDFNERVVECRLGARLLAKSSGCANWRELIRFAQLQQFLGISLQELELLALKHITEPLYKREHICDLLDVTEEELEREFLTANTQHMQQFKLRQRTLHVIQESLRVLEFRRICEHEVGNGVSAANGTNGSHNGNSHSSSQKLQQLARLMRQSHESLQVNYECSHADLERLVAISDELNVGARLTGAGWGGCIVALCDSLTTTKEYIHTLKQKYYGQLPAHILECHQHNDFNDVVFATTPCNGAEIFQL